MKFLIAEDDFVSRKALMKLIKDYGECDVTVDGREALLAYMQAIEENEPYDCICLDTMMPILDGYHVLQTIREEEQKKNINKSDECLIFMTTALSDEDSIQRATILGCSDYLFKPVTAEQLDKALSKTRFRKDQ